MKPLIIASILLMKSWVYAQPGSHDSTFHVGKGFDKPVQSIALQPDGKLIVGGEFKNYDGHKVEGLVRLNSDGKFDPTFNTKGKVNIRICRTIILQKDEKILVGGLIGDPYTDKEPYNIIRVNRDGSVDESFKVGNGFDDLVHVLALQPDGKIIVGGDFKPCLLRLNSDGSIDPTFKISINYKEIPFSIALQPDGKIIVAVRFSSSEMNSKNLIQRLNKDGSLDPTFTVNKEFNRQSEVWKIALTKDGKILAEGGLNNENSKRNMISRLNSNGSLDTTFKTYCIGRYRIYDIQIQPDDKIIVAGDFENIEDKKVSGIARLCSDGNIDSTFNAANFSVGQNKVALLQSGKVIATGDVNRLNITKDKQKYLSRLNGDVRVIQKK